MDIKKIIKESLNNSRLTFNTLESIFDLIKSAPIEAQNDLFLEAINSFVCEDHFDKESLLSSDLSSRPNYIFYDDPEFEEVYNEFKNDIKKYYRVYDYDEYKLNIWNEINNPKYSYDQSRRLFATYSLITYMVDYINPNNEANCVYDLSHHKMEEDNRKRFGPKRLFYMVQIKGEPDSLCNLSFDIAPILNLTIEKVLHILNTDRKIIVHSFYQLQVIKELAKKHEVILSSIPKIRYTLDDKNLNLFKCNNCEMYIPEDSKYCTCCSMPVINKPNREIFYLSPRSLASDIAFCPNCGVSNMALGDYCKNCNSKLYNSFTMYYPYRDGKEEDFDDDIPFF